MGSEFDSVPATETQCAFGRSTGEGLLQLAARWPALSMEAPEAFWRDFGKARLLREIAQDAAVLTEAEASRWAGRAPPLPGGEYLDSQALHKIWNDIGEAVRAYSDSNGGSLQKALVCFLPEWQTLGRICLSLAETNVDAARPFAMLATYTTKLSGNGKPQHMPLARVFATPLAASQVAAKIGAALAAAVECSSFVRETVESRRIFQTHALTAKEAYRFLCEIPLMEKGGLMVRVPSWWDVAGSRRVRVKVTVGGAKARGVGLGALVDFKVSLALGGQEISEAQWQSLQEAAGGLAFVGGQWVEADTTKINGVLDHWRRLESLVAREGLSFAHAMRLLSGAPGNPGREAQGTDVSQAQTRSWSELSSGDWLKEAVASLLNPGNAAVPELCADFRASLRPYQRTGLAWLWRLFDLGLGGCLADDMGLGKTIQVLALFSAIKRAKAACGPHLIIAPMTLIANWKAEAAKFAPGLNVFVAHSSETPQSIVERGGPDPATTDVVITTYGAISRYKWLATSSWAMIVLDEAQAIKNPAALQTLAAKGLSGSHRLALTGTPIENHPLDLWSIFDFINPGLLGTAAQFTAFLGETPERGDHSQAHAYEALRSLVRPYILRRLKQDRRIIADLPEKTEIEVNCILTPPQVALYERIVNDLKNDLKKVTKEIQRKGVVLSALTKLKQVCDHPTLVTGNGGFASSSSGKLQKLIHTANEIASRQEKLIVFTQFRAMTEAIERELAYVFGRPGLVLHGGTAARSRAAMVDDFQREDGPPFFVLSLRAGGTGLTLTAASHVIHFDRWWNPAVEDQATDRAFRIGQRRNVLVHKFTSIGTIEAKVAELIARKRQVAGVLLGGALAGLSVTELSDQALLELVSFDMSKREPCLDGDDEWKESQPKNPMKGRGARAHANQPLNNVSRETRW